MGGDSGTLYRFRDHLGCTRLVLTAAGEVNGRSAKYAAAAEMLFAGKLRDAETGLDYFGARYLSAPQGRFTEADAPFADQTVGDPQS